MEGLCFHREREDGYCWRCDQEKETERLLKTAPSPDEESGLKEFESDGESDH